MNLYKSRHILLCLAFLLIFSACLLVESVSAINIAACTNITTNGTYFLTANLTGSPNSVAGWGGISSACLKINSSNVLFDCNGYNITNTGVASSSGIAIGINYKNVTIQNCRIASYPFGI